MNNYSYSTNRFFSYKLLLLFFFPTIVTCFLPGSVVIPTALAGYCVAYMLFKYPSFLQKKDYDGAGIVKLFFLLNIYIYVRGFFNIGTVYDAYAMASTLLFTSILIPSLIYLSRPQYADKIWKSCIIWGIPLSIITYFFPPSDGIMSMGFNASFLNLFILFIPFVNYKWRLFIILLSILVIFSDLDERSIIVGLIFPFLIVVFWRFIKSRFTLSILFALFIIIPFLFVILGTFYGVNIFEILGSSDYKLQGADNEMFVDSRTGIYTDVIVGLYEKNSILWGLGGNGKIHSYLMDLSGYDFDSVYKGGRGATESGMLNYFLYSGVIGVIVYGLFLLRAAYLAIYKSKNRLMKMLGVFIAFKFTYSFIDDRIAFTCHCLYFFLWIGMCYNRSFRAMSDIEMKSFISSIFGNKTNHHIQTQYV